MADVIVGIDSDTYTPAPGDVGANIYCKVTATNAVGSATANSNTVGPVGAAAVAGPAPTNLWTWLKADAGVYSDAGTTAATNGGTVQQWNDSHTGGRHFMQTGATGLRPTWVTNAINTTLPVVRFVAGATGTPGEQQWLLGPSSAALTAGEIFIVVKKAGADPGDGSRANLWDFESNGQNNLYPYSDGNIYDGWGSGTRYNCGDPTPSLTTFRLYNVVSTPTEWTSYIDGTQHFTFSTSGDVVFSTGANLCRDTNTGNGFSGDVAELIMYSAKCSSADWVQTKTYIANKYGLTIDLGGR